MTNTSDSKFVDVYRKNLKITALRRLLDYTLTNVFKDVQKLNSNKILQELSNNVSKKLIVKKAIKVRTKQDEYVVLKKFDLISTEKLKEITEVFLYDGNGMFKILQVSDNIDNVVEELNRNGYIYVIDVSKGLNKKKIHNFRIIDKNDEKILFTYKLMGVKDKIRPHHFFDLFVIIIELANYFNSKRVIVVVNAKVSGKVFKILKSIRHNYNIDIRIIDINKWIYNYWKITKESISTIYIWKENSKWFYGIETATSPNAPSPVISIYVCEDGKKPNKNLKLI